MLTEDNVRQIIRQWFTDNGFTIVDIPRENGKKTPDFHLIKGIEQYLLELKIKGDNVADLARDSALLKAGQMVERSVPLSPRNTLDGIIEEGHEQMLAFDPQLGRFHILWIQCDGRDAHLLEERFRMTLFGQQRLISTEVEHIIHALYFRNSSFWRYRKGLDGVFLAYGTEVKLCINTLSERVDSFRLSAMFDLHQQGLCDPEALKNERDIFVVDGTVDRTDEQAVLAFLRQKYAIAHLQTFSMGAHSLMAPINGAKL